VSSPLRQSSPQQFPRLKPTKMRCTLHFLAGS